MTELKQLRKQDVLFVAGESAKIYQHTAGLVILDAIDRPGFGFDSFRSEVIGRLDRVPHFHWKLCEVPLGLDLPYWVEDEKFDYQHHIKRIAVPSPGDRESLAEVVAHLYSKHLDRGRPLWEIWFIEGLADGKFAILQKLHHCMMDGQGAMQLGQILCDFEADAKARPVASDIADATPGSVPELFEMSVATTKNLVRFPGEVYRGMYRYLRPRLLEQLWPGERAGAAKPALPMTSFNAEISSQRGFVFGSVPIADIKTVKNAYAVSVNDVVLALVSGSVRNYLLSKGELPDLPLWAGIAVSTRKESDDDFSNKVTTASVSLATEIPDPLERLREIHSSAEKAKELSRKSGAGVTDLMSVLPPVLVSAMVGTVQPEQAPKMIGANLIVSNVRGSSEPMYVAGARMETMYPMSILTSGMGINITCVSYAKNVDFGIAIEPDLVPEPWALVDGLGEVLSEYVKISRKNKAKQTTTRKKAATRKASVKRKVKPASRAKASTRRKKVSGNGK